MDKKKKKISERTRTLFLFTLPSVVMYTVFFTVTMAIGIYYSFTDWNGISASYKIIGIGNYIKALMDRKFQAALKFNFVYTFLFVLILIVISLLVAICLNNLTKTSTIFGILIVNLWQGCSIPIVLFLAGLQSVPSELYEAATIDGANRWDKFKSITFPFLIPVLNMVIITQVKAGLTIFDYIMAMTNGGPGGATQAVGILIYNQAMKGNAYSQSVAESMILFVIVAIVAAVTLKMTKNKQVGD